MSYQFIYDTRMSKVIQHFKTSAFSRLWSNIGTAVSRQSSQSLDSKKAQFGCAPGVIRTRVGYTGGTTKFPTYRNLGDHTETVDIDFDPDVTSYEKLLEKFWKSHNPTQSHSRQYMSAIFFHGNEQRVQAETSMKEQQSNLAQPIATKILPAHQFYVAEDYHQKYMLRNSRDLFDSLGLDGEDLVKSHAAARANGYVAGFGKLQDFNNEFEKVGYSKRQIDLICKAIQRRS
ncbi:unnamed protein product [Owenia fusiformis]|uniref:peptide-methionine (S)-S-oxide reductase n=1 Tax=Owenia fusiformis TaxID=6347 RepID=A0A8J1URQ1_OWEFU|nr:unnamed protein product [Owenia fusiformis]